MQFGIMLWQMVTCEVMPFPRATTVGQILMGVSQGILTPHWPDSCHPDLAKLGRACLQTNPARRPSFQDIDQVGGTNGAIGRLR